MQVYDGRWFERPFPKRDVGKYYITDIESGYQIECTKEQHEAYLKMWEDSRPILKNKNGELFGQITLFGTMATEDKNNFEDLWNDNQPKQQDQQ